MKKSFRSVKYFSYLVMNTRGTQILTRSEIHRKKATATRKSKKRKSIPQYHFAIMNNKKKNKSKTIVKKNIYIKY